jgi:hypothetical protein
MAHDALGERRLMLAVLEDAIRTLLLAKRTAVPRKRLLRELAWLESTSHAEPFAFESICDALGFDPAWLRARLVAGAFRPVRVRRMSGSRTRIRHSGARGAEPCSASF